MRPLHLNLASKPYRDNRTLYAAITAMGLLTAFLLLNNVQTAFEYRERTRNSRTELAAIEAETRREQTAAAAIRTDLDRIDLKRLNYQTTFINQQFVERSFSWSELLDTLERVLPRDVRVNSLNPTIDKQGRITLELLCVAKQSNGMVQVLNALFADPHFSRPLPKSESKVDQYYRLALSVDYRPEAGGLLR